jgi:L-ascorbate metabolism protein UlaG (beta-lactamase superfamily)
VRTADKEGFTMRETLEVTWYGQSMFSIKSRDLTVVVDPTAPETGYRYDPVPADVVLVTHQHFDHGYTAGVTGDPEIISESGTFDVGSVKVQGFDSFHDGVRGSERGPNVIYTWEQAGLRLGHFGDLGETPAPDIVKGLLDLDIAMIPVGGVFTIDGEQAVRLIGDIGPHIVFPMHYGTAEGAIPLDPVDGFTAQFKGTVREISERPLEVSRDSIPAGTEVWVLPYK